MFKPKVIMHINTDPALIEEVTSRSIDTIYPTAAAFKAALSSGKQLTFYLGIDPTATYVHLGHATNCLVLERLHKLGHRIIVLVGDFTATLGDPSDKTSLRQQLSAEDVQKNLATFKEQIGKVLDFDDTENPIAFKFNSAWLSKLTFQDSVELASNFTLQQMIERDAFKKRIKAGKPLYVHEFFYPLMQGYDSVALDVDAEIGGTDQTFNMLAGRTLQKRYNNKEKFVISTTLLENPETGEKLMSKSLGTGVGLDLSARDMFFKTMQLPDAGIVQTFVDCTRLPMADIQVLQQQLASGTNPRDVKLALSHEIVTMYHDNQAANDAKNAWLAEVSNKQLPADIPVYQMEGDLLDVVKLLVDQGIVDTTSAARRLIAEGAVKLNSQKITELTIRPQAEDLLQIGKKYHVRVTKRR